MRPETEKPKKPVRLKWKQIEYVDFTKGIVRVTAPFGKRKLYKIEDVRVE